MPLDTLILKLFQGFPGDSGPIYEETVQGRFPVEPFNTYSNFLFLIVGLYFALKVYKNWKQHRFLAWVLSVLFVGFIGGTIYHATRSAEIWLYLDWVPIVFLCLRTSFYFAWKAGKALWQKVLISFGVLAIPFLFQIVNWPDGLNISLGYIGTALGVLIPIFIYAARIYFKRFYLIALAMLSFGAAISFRISDQSLDFLAMGSHWLWHTFGAIAVFLVMQYVFMDNRDAKSKF